MTEASTDDPENQLWDCSARRVPFGDPAVDVLRCLTFRFDPPDDITSAVLYLDIDAPTNSLQDTDSLVVAVGEPFDECVPAQGAMAGCVTVHGGFQGGERSLVVNLADLACDASTPVVDAPRQQAVLAQLATGVVHVMLQDDTMVNGAWLDINGAPAPAACGTQTVAVPGRGRPRPDGVRRFEDGGGLGTVPKVAIAVGRCRRGGGRRDRRAAGAREAAAWASCRTARRGSPRSRRRARRDDRGSPRLDVDRRAFGS